MSILIVYAEDVYRYIAITREGNILSITYICIIV